jgi:hypothetical protein
MEEKIFFKDSKGNNICGILSNPNSKMEKPIIILCHGFMMSKDSNTNTKLQNILNKENISTFRFDFFGHGESEGEFGEITISKAVDNILDAIQFLKNKGYSKIGLVGSSFSGTASINAASKTNDLFLLALKCPVSNYLERELKKPKEETEAWKNKGYRSYYYRGEEKRVNYSFFEDFKNNDGYEAAKKIKIPTLIVHGDEDKTISIEQSKKTASLIENCKLEIIKGADHGFNNPGEFEKMLDLISGFIVDNC